MTVDVAKQIISFVLKRIGKKNVTESEMYLTLSMRLQWCPPNIAKQFVKRCIQDEILIREQDALFPGYPIDSVSIPLGFKPSSDFFNKYTPKQSALEVNDAADMLKRIISKTINSQEDFSPSVKTIMEEKSITNFVALLLFAKKHDIDISHFIDTAEKEILIEN